MPAAWKDFQQKGYVVIPRFLTAKELAPLRDDYARVTSHPSATDSYDVRAMTPSTFAHYVKKLAAVKCVAPLGAKLAVGGFYFATARMSFEWHQDHDSYFTFQQHERYLNFYVPITKPDRKRSNVDLVPFDRLHVRGGGAKRYTVEGARTIVDDDETGEQTSLDLSLDDLAETPKLAAGDLLIMRGDMIHRTQRESDANRVAASFRFTDPKALIRRDRLDTSCPMKDAFIKVNTPLHAFLSHCFDVLGKDTMTAAEMIALR